MRFAVRLVQGSRPFTLPGRVPGVTVSLQLGSSIFVITYASFEIAYASDKGARSVAARSQRSRSHQADLEFNGCVGVGVSLDSGVVPRKNKKLLLACF